MRDPARAPNPKHVVSSLYPVHQSFFRRCRRKSPILPHAELLVLVVLLLLLPAVALDLLEFGLEQREEDEFDKGGDLGRDDEAGTVVVRSSRRGGEGVQGG